MNINLFRSFFKWCTIINGGLLILSAMLIRFAGVWIFEIHHSWIPITEDAFPVAIYILLGIFKLIVIVFNVVPYIALVIIGRNQASNQVPEATARKLAGPQY